MRSLMTQTTIMKNILLLNLKVISLFTFLFFLFSCKKQDTPPITRPVVEWQKCLGGSGMEYATFTQQTRDGGYIVAGYSNSNDGDVTGNHGGYDYWVVKLSSTGSIQWQKCLGGSGMEYATFTQQTTDGGYIVAGCSDSNDGDVSGNHGGGDYWVVKMDNTGNIQWQKCLGGSNADEASSVQQTADGGYIVAGWSNSNNGDVSGNHAGSGGGSGDYWVVKLGSTGSIQWQKCLGGSGDDFANFIQQTTDGGYVVAGGSGSHDGDVSGNHSASFADDYWVVKMDNTGNIQWQKCLGGFYNELAYSIRQTTDGGYIVAGLSGSNDGDVSGNHGGGDYWVVKMDNTGNIQWQKCLGGFYNDFPNSIRQATDGGYIVAGLSGSNDGDVSGNHGAEDYWVVKMDNTGNIQWQKCLGGSGVDRANFIQQTTGGGYIVVGSSVSNDGDVSGNHGQNDYWVVKLTTK